jgi:hypothetical protein
MKSPLPLAGETGPSSFRNRASIALLALFLAGLPFAGGQPLRAGSVSVDLALVLALDCSGSVDEEEFALQMRGLADAFRRRETAAAIRKGDLQRIAVSVVHWSGSEGQATVLPWSVIADAADAENFASLVDSTPRGVEPTTTALSSALLYSEALLATAPGATRRVIDLAADGPGNIGPPLGAVRGKLLSQGITINGLAIENEWRRLGVYMQNDVAGGADHFVVTAKSYDAFADAIFRKLLKEITGPGVS